MAYTTSSILICPHTDDPLYDFKIRQYEAEDIEYEEIETELIDNKNNNDERTN